MLHSFIMSVIFSAVMAVIFYIMDIVWFGERQKIYKSIIMFFFLVFIQNFDKIYDFFYQ